MTKDEIILAQQARIEQLRRVVGKVSGTVDAALSHQHAAWKREIDASLVPMDNLSALRAHDAELLADALRYRAIKQWHKAYVLGGIAGGGNIHLLTLTRWPEQLDAAIDEAIEKGGV